MSALVLPIAHAGHWINAGLYLSPLVVIAALLWVQNRRDKRNPDVGDEREPEEDAEEG
jgi:hypothetical protein